MNHDIQIVVRLQVIIAYEINRRFIFAMKLFDVSTKAQIHFAVSRTIPKIFSKKVYFEIITNIYYTTKADIVFSEAAVKEKWLTASAEETEPAGLTVSGDGT